MNYDQAKAHQGQLEAARDEASERLNNIGGIGSGPFGLTPDSVKASTEYRQARLAYDIAHAKLASFNGWFVKTFAREYRAERRQRVAA